MQHSQVGGNTVPIVVISMLASILGGFVSFMDQHTWVAVIITGLGAAVISTTGSFLVNKENAKLRAELKKVRQHHAAGAGK